MGTRIWHETLINQAFTNLKALRIHSLGGFQITVYVAEENNQLSEKTIEEINTLLRKRAMVSLRYQVKPYSMIEADNVPEITDLPDSIRSIAQLGRNTQDGVIESINSALPYLKLDLAKIEKDLLTIWLPSDIKLSEPEKTMIKQYLYELVPMGLRFEII